MKWWVFISSVIIILQNIQAQPKYDDAVAKKMMIFCSAAYAGRDFVQGWSFPNQQCQETVPNFSVYATFVSSRYFSDAFGYVGVDADTKTIVVAFRGTHGTLDEIHDALNNLENWHGNFNIPCQLNANITLYAHVGFCDWYHDVQEQGIIKAVTELYDRLRYPIYITGHSLGGAAAVLSAVDIASSVHVNGASPQLILYTLGEPRVGDVELMKLLLKYNIIAWRVVHNRDMFVHIPRCCNEGGVCATDQKCPYHESAEVFYGSDMTHPPTICLSPEDLKCSGGLTMPISIDDHTHYFGVQVGSYCKEAPEQM